MDCDLDLHLEPFLNILKRLALKKDVEQTFKCHSLKCGAGDDFVHLKT